MVTYQQGKSQEIYNALEEELRTHDIEVVDERQLTAKQKRYIRQFFREKISPALTKLMLSQAPEFPYLRDKSIFLAVRILQGKDEQFSIIEVPTGAAGRFVTLTALWQAVRHVFGRCVAPKLGQHFLHF
jgi:polyphosphate kinase